MNLINNKYNKWIDYIKFTCILFIIFMHSKAQTSAYFTHITLATFFFFAGFLFNPEKHQTFYSFFKHRAKRLLVPYFCFFAIIYLLWLLSREYLSEKNEIAFYLPLLEYLYGRPKLLCWPLWFIPCLFLIQCIVYFLNYLIKNRILLTILSILLSLLPIIFDLHKFPFMFDQVCIFICFYVIAFLYKKELFFLLDKIKSYFFGILCVVLFFIFNNLYTTFENPFLIRAIAIIGNLSIIVVFSIFTNTLNLSDRTDKITRYITNDSIVILALHNYVLKIFYLLYKYIYPSSYNYMSDSYIFNFCLSFITLLLMIIPIYLINKYIPFILGKGRFWENN